MSDQESFLTRWSRLKREADDRGPEPGPAASPDRQAAETSEPAPRDPVAAAPQPEAPAVDLAALPPIDSITALTDIRAFLAPGVPAQLARAALRRAWSADPAIRDFVGLAENAWDFTAPDGVPGFGPLEPSGLVQRAIAEGLTHDAPVSSLDGKGETSKKPELGAQPEEPLPQRSAENAPPPDKPGQDVGLRENTDAAVQDENSTEESHVKTAQTHGGALPRW